MRFCATRPPSAPGAGSTRTRSPTGPTTAPPAGALFDSTTKFESGSGWPSFTEPAVAEAVELVEDRSHGMVRTEVRCRNCGSHLGHVFDDGPADRGGQRYCINSLALDLDSDGDE